jgi:hypothetical protein
LLLVNCIVGICVQQVVLLCQIRQHRTKKVHRHRLTSTSLSTSPHCIDDQTVADNGLERQPLLGIVPSYVSAGNGKAPQRPPCCSPTVVDGPLSLDRADESSSKPAARRQLFGSYPNSVCGKTGTAYGTMDGDVTKNPDIARPDENAGVHSALQVNYNQLLI